ncbi:hypothetical protein [Novosphingobium sp.]|uniref:hypothetical protein n=1 Tax=Novosphingobium sp. TaxID=1874826 RepID=UPI003BAD9F62
MMKKLAATLALAAMTMQPVLAAPEKCITGAEMRVAARFVMPILINGVSTKCAPVLGNGSYLATKGPDLLKRYEALPGDESAVPAIVERFDTKGELSGMSAAELRVFLKVGLFKAMGKDLTPEVCGKVDRVLTILDPLPAENTVALFEFVFREVEASDAKKAQRAGRAFESKICPAS